MSIVLAEMRRTYAAQRGVSQGASITLACASGGYVARFECAKRCAALLGDRNMADGLLYIPMDEVHRSLTKLSETQSVSLVDTFTDEAGTRFVLVWRIVPTRKEVAEDVELVPVVLVDANQGDLNLDEY